MQSDVSSFDNCACMQEKVQAVKKGEDKTLNKRFKDEWFGSHASPDTYDAGTVTPAERCLELDAIEPGITEMLVVVPRETVK